MPRPIWTHKQNYGGGPTGVNTSPASVVAPANSVNGDNLATLIMVGGTGTPTFSVFEVDGVTPNANLEVISGNILTPKTGASFSAGVNQSFKLGVHASGGGSDYLDSVSRTLTVPAGPSSISHSPDSILDNATLGTTGTTLTANGGYGVGTWSILIGLSYFNLSVTTGVSSSLNLNSSGVGNLVPGVPITGTVRYTDAANQHIDQAISITVVDHTAATTITPMTVVNKAAVNQTSTPITFGLPLAPGTLASGRTIQILDGATPLPCQIDRISDVDLNGDQRHVIVTTFADISSLGSKQLTIQNISGSDATGTSILASDILATSYDFVTTLETPTGTWTASSRDGLSSALYTNLSTNGILGKYRDGPYCSEYICIVPFKQGGTPHPQLRVRFVVTAFKLGSGSVSGGNPIIAIRTDRLIENGNIDNTTPVDDWYNITSDVCGSYTHSWIGPASTVDLTLSANSVNVVNITAASSFFGSNNDCCGWLISDGTGYGIIASKTSTTAAKIMIAKPFASAVLTAGNYKVYAISHWYGSEIYGQKFGGRAWWTGGKTPDLDAALGTPWDINDPTSGPFPYINSTKMVPNYVTLATDVATTEWNTGLSSLSAQGDNPSGLQITSVGGSGASGIGGLSPLYQPGTGQSDSLYIATVNAYQINALIKYDSIDILFKSAEKSMTCPWHFYDNATGISYRMNAASELNSTGNPAAGQKYQYNVFHCWTPSNPAGGICPWTVQAAHNSRFFYVPYLISGDYVWNNSLQMQAFNLWFGLSPYGHNVGYFGKGYDNVVLVYGSEDRGFARGLCCIGDAAAMAPPSAGILQDSGMWRSSLQHMQTALNSNSPGVYPQPGTLLNNVGNSGAGKRFDTNGPRWINPNGTFAGPWQICFVGSTLGHLSEIGMMGSDVETFYDWLAYGIVENCVNTTDSVPDYLAPTYFFDTVTYLVNNDTTQTKLHTYAEVYRYTAIDPTHGQNRTINGDATLDSLSGTGVQATMPTGQFNGGLAFYQNGSIVDMYNRGATNITSIPNAGSGYTVGDTLTLAVTPQVGETIVRQAEVVVASVNGSGGITGVNISDGGLYQGNSVTRYELAPSRGSNPTGGTGSGATLNASINGGVGLIVGVSGDVLTLDTTKTIYAINDGGVSPAYKTYQCRPFASTTLVALKYKAPWSAPGDPVGADRATYFAGNSDSYMSNLWAALSNAIDKGVPNAVAARTWWESVRSVPVTHAWNINAR